MGEGREEEDSGRRRRWRGEGCRETELMERRMMVGEGVDGKEKDAGRRR